MGTRGTADKEGGVGKERRAGRGQEGATGSMGSCPPEHLKTERPALSPVTILWSCPPAVTVCHRVERAPVYDAHPHFGSKLLGEKQSF